MKKTEATQQSPHLEQENSESTNLRCKPPNPDPTSEPGENQETFLDEVQEVLGILPRSLALKLLAQAAQASQIGGIKESNDWRYPLEVLRAIGPKDELETLLATQMAGTHSLGMEFLRRVANAKCSSEIDSQINRVTKLLKLFSTQIEALTRHRARGQQKMLVEHVHIHSGGQAIVGTLNHEFGTASRESAEKQV